MVSGTGSGTVTSETVMASSDVCLPYSQSATASMIEVPRRAYRLHLCLDWD